MQIELTKPIKHGQEVIDVLTLREPTAKDIKTLGLPFDVSTKNVDTNAVFNYLVALAALPPSVIDQMSASDFTKAIGGVASFFGDSAQ